MGRGFDLVIVKKKRGEKRNKAVGEGKEIMKLGLSRPITKHASMRTHLLPGHALAVSSCSNMDNCCEDFPDCSPLFAS